MSDLPSKRREALVAYAIQALQLDPAIQSPHILQARNAAFNRKHDDDRNRRAALDQQPNRRDVVDRIHRLRNSIWSLPLDKLRAEVAALSVARSPDLQAPLARLATLSANREALERLSSKFDEELWARIKGVLVFPANETAVLKESVRRRFCRPIWRRRQRRVLGELRQTIPEVYALDQDWFDSLLRQPMSFWPHSDPVQPVTTRRSNDHLWIALLVLLGILVGILQDYLNQK